MSIRSVQHFSVQHFSGSSISFGDFFFFSYFAWLSKFHSSGVKSITLFLPKSSHIIHRKKWKELPFMPCQCRYKLKKKKERSCRIIINVEYKHGLFCLNGRNFSHDPDVTLFSLLSLLKVPQVISSYSFISYNPQY